jgi:hypothetical protein
MEFRFGGGLWRGACRDLYGTCRGVRMNPVTDAESKSGGADVERTGNSSGAAAPDANAIREQLERVLGSPHFRNSKRSQALLRFVTESLLEGQKEALKEKIIGIEVFGREASYDTSHDAIVRNAAIEVRKRLAQYYLDPGHECELRIGLPAGSYAPTFTADPGVEAAAAEHQSPAAPEPEHKTGLSRKAKIAAAGVIGVLIVAAGLVYRSTAPQDMDRFWNPLFRARETVQICVGQPGRLYRFVGSRQQELDGVFMGQNPPAGAAEQLLKRAPIGAGEIRWNAHRYLYMRDAFAMARVVTLIQAKGATFRMRPDSDTSFSELRRSPVIVIGGFNSHWALRFGDGMRFIFDHKTIDGRLYNCITDKRDPAAKKWMVSVPGADAMQEDYAVVTRVVDPTTERTVVLVAGIEDYGTLAAGEFITDAGYMNGAFRDAPRDWYKRNVQLVLRTRLIDGGPGPATVVATHFW